MLNRNDEKQSGLGRSKVRLAFVRRWKYTPWKKTALYLSIFGPPADVWDFPDSDIPENRFGGA